MSLVMQLLLVGLAAGIAGGMFGIGGGAIMVPAMVLLLGLNQKFATGTSIAAQIFPIGILGAFVYYREGNMDIKQAVYLAIGLIIGNLLGALFANQPYISNDLMKKLYGWFLLLIGARYLVWDYVYRAYIASR
ncbi:MAG TPA: sulfite exporter TauE/SafE family protein [Herpetosiphonaceae bacterium]